MLAAPQALVPRPWLPCHSRHCGRHARSIGLKWPETDRCNTLIVDTSLVDPGVRAIPQSRSRPSPGGTPSSRGPALQDMLVGTVSPSGHSGCWEFVVGFVCFTFSRVCLPPVQKDIEMGTLLTLQQTQMKNGFSAASHVSAFSMSPLGERLIIREWLLLSVFLASSLKYLGTILLAKKFPTSDCRTGSTRCAISSFLQGFVRVRGTQRFQRPLLISASFCKGQASVSR